MIPILFWILFIFFTVIFIRKVIFEERGKLSKRIQEAKLIASQMGFTLNMNRQGFHEIPPELLITKIKNFDLTHADGYQIEQCIGLVFEKKNKEMDIYLFEHSNPPGDVGPGHTETVACFISPRLNLPQFRICPENLVYKGLNLLGIRDVDFNHYSNFSKNYFLNGQDETAIRLIFTSQILRFFEENQGLWVEGSQDTLIYYRFKTIFALKDMPVFYEQAKSVANLFV